MGDNDKLCNHCKTIKTLDSFGDRANAKDNKNPACKACRKEYYQQNKQSILLKVKYYQDKNPDKVKSSKRNHYLKFRDKILKKRLEYISRPEIKIRNKEFLRKYWTKRRESLHVKINHRISTAVRLSLVGNKAGRHWETLVGYTLQDLKQHLEKQFTEGMTWENMGKWHTDHIIPISAFNFSSPEHIDFKRCWALSNLRPLWAKENINKRAKLDRPFQPSLQLSI